MEEIKQELALREEGDARRSSWISQEDNQCCSQIHGIFEMVTDMVQTFCRGYVHQMRERGIEPPAHVVSAPGTPGDDRAASTVKQHEQQRGGCQETGMQHEGDGRPNHFQNKELSKDTFSQTRREEVKETHLKRDPNKPTKE